MALAESEQLLGELSIIHRERQPQISRMATALDSINKNYQQQLEELSK